MHSSNLVFTMPAKTKTVKRPLRKAVADDVFPRDTVVLTGRLHIHEGVVLIGAGGIGVELFRYRGLRVRLTCEVLRAQRPRLKW